MNTQLTTDTLKFFEKEGRAFACGNKSFQLWDSSLKGENSLTAPYGVQSFGEKSPSVLPIILPANIRDEFILLEQTIHKKMIEQIPDFIKGCKEYHSNMKTNAEGQCILTLKLSKETCIESYDVKKGTFSKTKLDSIPPGAKLSVGFTMRHPWKYDASGSMKYGASFAATDIVIYNDGSLKRQIAEDQPTIKSLMTAQSKKKTKMMTLKEEQAIL